MNLNGTPNRWHVIPLNDLREHEESAGCWCEPVVNDDGVLVHNAADKRELYERGERKVN